MVANPANPLSNVETSSKRVLLRADQPQFNHNGGGIAFGPDDLLYIAFGDGGGADDKDGQPFIGGDMVGHGSAGNGQDAMNPLGAILRIDPAGSNSTNGQYGIPGDNPFIGGGSKLDEIYAYGLRNAFRFSFDSQSDELYAADVGQNDIEEVNLIAKGGNYGWNVKEGSKYFYPSGSNSGYVSDVAPVPMPPGLIDPILEYDHDEGISVIGGFVYRGEKYEPMQGAYVFGDWSSDFSVPSGRLFYSLDGNTISEFRFAGRNQLDLFLQGFGQDQTGELYLLGNTTGTPFGSTGVVMRIDFDPEELCFPIRASYGYWAQICL
jgi:glucose/arabinose dehydrogenase